MRRSGMAGGAGEGGATEPAARGAALAAACYDRSARRRDGGTGRHAAFRAL
jgi:hypothetical protein